MTTRDELQEVLRAMPDVEEATVEGDRKLIATVVSGSFRDQNEAERQEVVWGYIRRQLGDDAMQSIEFIFANTPEENAA